MADLARFVVYRGRDPLTPPQTKIVWVNTDIPGIKQPVVKYKWMNTELDVVITGPDGDEVKAAVQGCLQQAAITSLISGLIAGYASGGTAAVSAALASFASTVDSCAEGKIGSQLDIGAETRNSSSWDDDWS
jgi:hypothetical protein